MSTTEVQPRRSQRLKLLQAEALLKRQRFHDATGRSSTRANNPVSIARSLMLSWNEPAFLLAMCMGQQSRLGAQSHLLQLPPCILRSIYQRLASMTLAEAFALCDCGWYVNAFRRSFFPPVSQFQAALVALLPGDGVPLVVQVWMGSMSSDDAGNHLTVCLTINFADVTLKTGETGSVRIPCSAMRVQTNANLIGSTTNDTDSFHENTDGLTVLSLNDAQVEEILGYQPMATLCCVTGRAMIVDDCSTASRLGLFMRTRDLAVMQSRVTTEGDFVSQLLQTTNENASEMSNASSSDRDQESEDSNSLDNGYNSGADQDSFDESFNF
jgi:hypothetical protein